MGNRLLLLGTGGVGGGGGGGVPFYGSTENLVLWADAQQETAYADGADLTVMTDWSDAGNHLNGDQTNPVLYRDGTTVEGINSLPAARLVEGDSFLAHTSYPLSAATSAEFFMVIQLNDNTGSTDRGIAFEGNPDFDDVYPYTDGNLYVGWATTSRFTAGANPIDLSTPHILNVISDVAAYTVNINGAQVGTRASNTFSSSSAGQLPMFGRCEAGAQMHGMIGEIVEYSAVTSSGNRATILAAMAARWGITLP